MSIPRPALLDALRDFFGPDAPIVAKAIATNEAKAEADRRAHGDAIAELERERDAKLPGLRAAHDKAVAARKALEEKLQAAHAAERAAFAAQRAFSFTTENDLATHRLALTETADPRIAGLAADIRSLQQRLRANGYTTDTEPGWVGLRQVNMAKGSNYEAINRRFAQCLDALRACEQLAATYTPAADIPAALARIVAMIEHGLDPHTPTEKFAQARALEDTAA